MQTLWHDLKYTLRQLRNAPVFALTAILTLALGLGATTAMLAVVDSVLLRPVSFPHAERLVSLELSVHGTRTSFTSKDFEALHANAKGFSALAGYGTLPSPVTTSAGTRITGVARISPEFFAVPGVRARLGRVLSQGDAHAPVAVVSDAFWRTSLHGDPHVIGSNIKVGNHSTTVVGVMPAGFAFPQELQGEALYVPLVLNQKGEDEHGFTSVELAARLKPRATLAAAQAEANAIYAHAGKANDPDRGQLVLRPYRKVITGYEQPALLALLGACGLLLLIACVNSANLQIARGMARTGEMSVRSALGASRSRLLRQIVTESVTISLLGAGLGLALASAALHWARAAYGTQFARFDELALHPTVFAGCTLLAVVAGVLAALAPALSAVRNAGGLPFSQSARVTRRSRLSGTLVAVEIALTCVLLATAGLFLRTFRALEQAPLGFDPHHVTEITLMLQNPSESGPALKQTYDRLLDRLSGMPGIEAAATQTSLPFSNFNLSMTSDFQIPGRPRGKKDDAGFSLVSAGFNRALGITMRQGRGLLPSDDAGSQPVCVVNEAFVQRYLSGRRVLGTTIEFPRDPKNQDDNRFMKTPLTIVGVAPDEIDGQSLAGRPGPMLLLNYRQYPADSPGAHFMFGLAPQFAVRSTLPLATLQREIRSALKDTAPDTAEMDIDPLDKSIAASLRNQQLALRLASGFGLLALALAAVGIYGVLAYSVAQRTREIGIRMALGSTRQGALRLVLGHAAVMALAGLAIGLIAAWPAGRAVRAFLFGVPVMDPLTLLAAALLLLAICGCAAAVPAYRATQVDPMEALRTE